MANSRTFSRPLIVLSVIASAAVIVGAGIAVSNVISGGSSTNPLDGSTPYVDPDSSAAKALSSATSAEKAAFTQLASTPAAIWLLPEDHATDEVGDFVASVANAASTVGQTPVFVVYGIPNRDCSNESAGGLSSAEYPAWVSSIAAGLVGHKAVVVLEPDSLALSVSCGNTDERTAEINDAVDRLAADGTSIYLDGGHSNWLDPQAQATLLVDAGIAKTRGFASNVSNFNPTSDEKAYDEKVSALAGGAHYIIDTSRNGNGANGEWCNPSGRKTGDTPAAVSDGTALDALLWIKNPGESDGECNGGPGAGDWWPAGALALVQ